VRGDQNHEEDHAEENYDGWLLTNFSIFDKMIHADSNIEAYEEHCPQYGMDCFADRSSSTHS